MTLLQRCFVGAVFLASFTTLPGLFYRGRARECWAYVAYLLALTSWGFCLVLWPRRFYVLPWWLAKQAVFDILKMAVAFELAYRTVRAFPGAQARLRLGMLTVLAGSTLMIASGPVQLPCFPIWEWQPRILLATVWLFAVTALAVEYYRLPVAAWHRALALTLTPKLVIFTVLIGVLAKLGWKARPWVNVVDGLADVAVSSALAYIAWRPHEVEDLSPRHHLAAAAMALA